jgi:hypothetical protein
LHYELVLLSFSFILLIVEYSILPMGVWQGLAMDFLKLHPGSPCPTLLLPAGRRPTAVYYHFGHPTPYVYDFTPSLVRRLLGDEDQNLRRRKFFFGSEKTRTKVKVGEEEKTLKH